MKLKEFLNERKIEGDEYDEKKHKKDFTAFVKDLEKISKKHGFALRSTGGINYYPDGVTSISYSTDHTSGDLEFYNLKYNS